MNTRLPMLGSAVFLAVLGFAAQFFPHEILRYLEADVASPHPVFIQLLGAALLGFAILNWVAQTAILGGIYGKPITLGNFLHFGIGVFALLRLALYGQGGVLIWGITVGYAVLTLFFGYLVFNHPAPRS